MGRRFGRPPSELLRLEPGTWDALAVDAAVLAVGEVDRLGLLQRGFPVFDVGG
jgi:hypothetical protein